MVSPGPVIELSEIVEIEGYPSGDSSFYMVSVMAREASIIQSIRAAVDRNLALWPRRQVLGGRSVEEYLEANRDLMEQSQVTATYVALTFQGMSVPYKTVSCGNHKAGTGCRPICRASFCP